MKLVFAACLAAISVACAGEPGKGPRRHRPRRRPPPPPAPTPCRRGTTARRRRAIVAFVGRVTKEGGPDFVPIPARIATFDNDGTLWAEKPLPFQLMFAFDRVKAMAPQHPEWKTKEPFASLLNGDMAGVAASGERGVLQIMAATHAGMTTEEFTQAVQDWIATARHPQTRRLYTEMVYQPMLELLAYLRANGFKTFIVSGGGVEFMRPWTERVYGIPPEQVVGSSGKLKLETRDGTPGADQACRDRPHRRQGRQAGRHPEPHRPPADCRVRQLRRRPADAAVDDGRRRARGSRCSSITTTPCASSPTTATDKLQKFNVGWDEARRQGLDRRQHAEGLEHGVPGPALTDSRTCPGSERCRPSETRSSPFG